MTDPNVNDGDGTPFDPDAERTVLGLFLRSTPDTDAAIASVQVNDFHLPHHRTIASAARAVHIAGGPRGTWPVIERLVDDGLLVAAGGIPAIELAVSHRGDDPVRSVEIVIGMARACTETEVEMLVDVAAPAFPSNNKWRLSNGTAGSFWSTIGDGAFLNRVNAGEPFRKGDSLRCLFKITRRETTLGPQIEHHVVEVRQHIARGQQLRLDEAA